MVAAMSLLSAKIRYQQRSRPAAPDNLSGNQPTIQHEPAEVRHHNANPCGSGKRVQCGDKQQRHRQGRFPTAEKVSAPTIRAATSATPSTTTTTSPLSSASSVPTGSRTQLRQPVQGGGKCLPLTAKVTVLSKQQTPPPPVPSGRPHTSGSLPNAGIAATDVKSRPSSATPPGSPPAPVRR